MIQIKNNNARVLHIKISICAFSSESNTDFLFNSAEMERSKHRDRSAIR